MIHFFLLLLICGGQAEPGPPGCSTGSSPGSTKYLASISCTKEHISVSLRCTAPCQPRNKVIMVPWPNNTSVDQLTPSHVTVRRCSGGCHSQARHCVPTHKETRSVPVLLGRCPLGGGKC